MEDVSGAITYPKGFKSSGIRAGIKEKGEDIALIVSEQPAASAGVFTTNVAKAAPVIISSERVPGNEVRAVIVNSGNANACTGEQGIADARKMAAEIARLLGVAENDVLVASTGIIGRAMPMDKVIAGIGMAVDALGNDGTCAARAIMTTDTRPKEASVEVEIGGVKVRIGGIAKGAGMICPNVATMLSFITTDAAIKPEMLQRCLSKSADVSYNCLTVDGDSSTNDTVIIMANGMAGNPVISSPGADLDGFQRALDSVTISLAKQIARDGEGATKIIEITVKGTDSFEYARQIAKTIANSPLVKTAMFGCDPNWGRVLAAAGRAGIVFNPKVVNLYFGETALLLKGEPVKYDEKREHDNLTGDEVRVLLEVGKGSGVATVWTCDFSYDYIRINAEYHT